MKGKNTILCWGASPNLGWLEGKSLLMVEKRALKAEIRKELKDRLGVEEGRPVTLKATANAVKGRVPG